MKKLLSIITGFSLVISPSLFAISCSPKVQINNSFSDITSIKNTKAFKNNQAFISRNELKEIVSETTTTNGVNNSGTTTSGVQTNHKNYATNRLKALAADSFTKNKQQAWESLKKVRMTFYKKVEPTAINVLGYEEIKKETVDKLEKDLKTIFLVFKDNNKESEKLEVELLSEINSNNQIVKDGVLYLEHLEKPENLKLANQKSIVEVLRKYFYLIPNLLNNSKENTAQKNNSLKETEFFNNIIKDLSSYLANAVKYFNSESGVVLTNPNFSYKTRSKQIYEYITKNKKDDLYTRLSKVFSSEFNKIDFIDVFKDFEFDKDDIKNNSNDKKIITKIIKSSPTNSSSSSTTTSSATTR
ncbi:putative lipoprotein [Mycoplasma leachii PG50]|uniref:Putative lipoprotein n=1 Tax=Mycoplasma leachii (strain DSM 21131 / NCTC 10133 / N29 / PG50) TaxID=880447 RepID=E4PT73_MYCLG|nr:lipoprotein [Mycoplasma leachii]ADR23917.1 putative lipoprotein [Mycoplasma leachii PG50]CBV66810.1 Lipoprotein, putative [Mycoplasma leachii 99/014/6]